jgi:DNA-binding MarR family transcriptional regulator
VDPYAPVGPALIRIAALVTDRYEGVSRGLGVDFRTGRLLVAVTRKPQTVGELGRHVRVGKSTMTGIMARLVADGLVERTPDPADRRASLITPTARGREIADTLLVEVRAAVQPLVDALGPEQGAALGDALRAILDAADAADGLLPLE